MAVCYALRLVEHKSNSDEKNEKRVAELSIPLRETLHCAVRSGAKLVSNFGTACSAKTRFEFWNRVQPRKTRFEF